MVCDIVYLTLGAFPQPSQPVKQGVSTCGQVLSFICFIEWATPGALCSGSSFTLSCLQLQFYIVLLLTPI